MRVPKLQEGGQCKGDRRLEQQESKQSTVSEIDTIQQKKNERNLTQAAEAVNWSPLGFAEREAEKDLLLSCLLAQEEGESVEGKECPLLCVRR